jgi:type IV pilus assembly protein PilO
MAMDLGLEKLQPHLERLARLPKPYQMATLPALAALVLGVYVYFFYLPASRELAQVQDQHLTLQRKLNEVRSVAANVATFEQEIAELEKKLSIALRQLPNSKELPVLLTDVTSLGKNAGLDFRAFRPGVEIKRDFYAEVPIDIEFSGRYHDIAGFFDEVSRLPRIVNVGELEVTIADENTQETFLNVKGQARTFRFLEESQQQAAAPAGKGAPAKGAAARGAAAKAAPAAKGKGAAAAAGGH